MGLDVPLFFPGRSLRRERRLSTIAVIAPVTSSGTSGPPCAPVPPRRDRLSPP